MSDSQEYPANHCLNKEVWDILVFLHLKTVNYSFFLKLTYGVIQQRKWRKCQYLTRCKVEDDNVFLIVTEKKMAGDCCVSDYTWKGGSRKTVHAE